jgi:uncharacterized SAM-binding protein YcdF (DUF218 family)
VFEKHLPFVLNSLCYHYYLCWRKIIWNFFFFVYALHQFVLLIFKGLIKFALENSSPHAPLSFFTSFSVSGEIGLSRCSGVGFCRLYSPLDSQIYVHKVVQNSFTFLLPSGIILISVFITFVVFFLS